MPANNDNDKSIREVITLKHKAKKKILALLLSLSATSSTSGIFEQALAQSEASNDEITALKKEVERLTTSGRKKEDLADSLYKLGKALAEQRNFVEAQSNLEQAVAVDLPLGKNDAIVKDYVALAMVYAYQKNFDKAQDAYSRALTVAKANQMVSWIVNINNGLGTNAIFAGKFDQARAFLTDAKSEAKNANNYVGEAQARLNLAIISEHDGNIKEAISETEEAGKLLGSDNQDPVLAAQTALNLGKLKDKIGDLDGAAAQYQLAAESGADFRVEANAWLALGNVKLSRGQAKSAEADFSKALEIDRAENVSSQVPAVITRLGCARADMGDFSAAEKLHGQAVQAARANNNNDALYAALYEQAYDYYLEGNSERALTKFEEVKKVLAAGLIVTDTGALADTTNAVALCYRAMGQLAVAREYYAKAMDMYNQAGNKLSAVSCQNSIACAFLDGSNLSEFKREHDQVAAALAALPQKDKESRDYKRLAADVAYNFAQSQVVESNFDGALASFKEALAVFTPLGDMRGQMNAYIGMGLARFSAGRVNKENALLTEAISYFDQARTLAASLGSNDGQWDAAIGAGACYRTLGDNAQAEKNLTLAIQLFEKEKGHFSRDDAKTFTLDLRYSAFEELVGLLYDQKRFEDALAVAERGRARAFLDLLEGHRRNLFGEGKLAALTGGSITSGVGTAPESVGLQNTVASSKSGNDKPIALVAMAETGANSAITRGVKVVERSQNDLETALSPINVDAPSLEQIKALVSSHKTYAVEYFVAPERLYIFVAKPDGTVTAVSQPVSRRDLSKMVDTAYTSIISPPTNLSDLKGSNDRREKNLTDLYSLLVAPVKDLLPQEASTLVTIVPHRTLFLVPFAALLDNKKKFFIEEHTLAVVPAIGVLRATERMASERNAAGAAAQDKLLAFGNPAIKVVPGLGALPFAEQEVKKISSLFGADRSMVKIGNTATKSALTALAPNYGVIHLATHGLIDEEHPMDSAVLLATEGGDDGILSVREILKMPALKARLVTLSACQTGRGKISGDGVAGLSRSFIIAGTPSVMVSLWNVDDVMTAFEMECFYKDYLASQSKAVALRAAQMKTISFMEKGLTAAGSRANPRYWAAFQLIGEAE